MTIMTSWWRQIAEDLEDDDRAGAGDDSDDSSIDGDSDEDDVHNGDLEDDQFDDEVDGPMWPFDMNDEDGNIFDSIFLSDVAIDS